MLRILKVQRPTGLLASLSKEPEPGTLMGFWQVVSASFRGDIEYIDKPGPARQLRRYLLQRRRFCGDRFFTVSMDQYAVCAIGARLPVSYLCWSTPAAPLKKAIFGVLARRCHTIIVNDTITRDVLENRYGVRSENIQFIRLGVDIDFFKPGTKARGKKIVIPGSAFRDETAAEEILAHTDYTVVRLTNNERISNFYENLVKQYGDRIILYRNVRHDQLPGIYSECSACVLHTTKFSEPAGLTCLLEALACGLPVFTNNPKSGADYIEPGKTGSVYEGLPELVTLLNKYSAGELGEMGNAARTWVQNTVSWPVLQPEYDAALTR